SFFSLSRRNRALPSFPTRRSSDLGVFTANMLNLMLAGLTIAAVWLAGREFGRLPGLAAGLTAATCPWLTWLSGIAYVENGMLFLDRKSTRLNSSHVSISYAVFCLK